MHVASANTVNKVWVLITKNVKEKKKTGKLINIYLKYIFIYTGLSATYNINITSKSTQFIIQIQLKMHVKNKPVERSKPEPKPKSLGGRCCIIYSFVH